MGSPGILTRSRSVPSPLTTPDAVTLQAALRTMADERLACAVIEVSSHALMQSRACGVRLGAGILTELLPYEHTDVHATFRHYLATKARFFELLRPEAPLVYSGASLSTVALASRWPASLRLRYVMEDGGPAGAGDGQADCAADGERGLVEGRILSTDLSGVELALAAHLDGRSARACRVRIPVIGPHAASNAVAAAAAALAMGVDFDAVVSALPRIVPPRRRMEPVCRGEFTVIDDTAGHPASFEQLFRALEASGARSIVLLVGVRGSRGAESARVRPLHLPALADGVATAVSRLERGDVLVLAGAQGLDRAAEMVHARQGSAR